jgi:hypothetical protein
MKRLERVWFRQELADQPEVSLEISRGSGRMPRHVVDYPPFDYRRYFFLLGFALFGVASGIGVFVGWLIWG